ncbi:MAG: Cof-type HAD-IIB family hydrolase [Alkalibacterium sp.]|uniref:Cof-type HAD-IIB family hydrolase n=1 Tax=Alkalibacterium sp. TaxID=1872447 RepID=UPI003970AA14
MTIKAIVCDMDGTLLTSDSLIDPQTLDKLKELQKKGIKLILASGRSYIRLLPDALKLDMEKHGGMVIDVNGTSIYDVSSKKRDRLGMLNSFHINKINEFFSSFNVEIQYSQDDTIYTYLPEEIYTLKKNIRGEMKLPDDYPWMGGMYGWLCDTRDGYPYQHMIRSLQHSPESCNKISIVQDPHYMSFVKETLTKHAFIGDYEFVFSDERKMEITNKNINKGNALKALQEKLNILDDELIVFGDSENDVSMFHGRKYSIAMANALPLAKQSANFHTEDHNHSGVYSMLNKFEQNGLF